jgi:acetyltransferase
MRIIGPNCVGVMNMNNGLNATFIKGMPEKGPIAFISQSGAIFGGVVDLIIESKIGFSRFASMGNEMDVSEAEMIEFFGEDPEVGVIAVYLEGAQNGPRFMDSARKISKKKPIVLLKAGKSNAGAQAVSSHTGSLAGEYAAYQAVFEQTGIIEVQTLDALINTAWALGVQPMPTGNSVAIATNAGGAAALLADELGNNGYKLAQISPKIQAELHTKLNPSAQVANPVDMLGQAEPQDYAWSLTNLIKEPAVDVLVPILVPQALVDTKGVAKAWVEAAQQTEKTILTCLVGERSTREANAFLNASGVPVFRFPEQIGPVLAAMRKFASFRQRPDFTPVQIQGISPERASAALTQAVGKIALAEHDTRTLLDAYGIANVPGGQAKDDTEAVQIAEKIGYPVVIKIAAEGLLHKSEVGGIRLNLSNAEELRVAYNEMLGHIAQNYPEAHILGVMVEKMAPKGQEVIVGMRRDATFGPMLMFGMGGVLVEQIKDIRFKVAPLSEEDIDDMVTGTIAGKLLAGYRGAAKGDIDAVKDVIARLSQLALTFPEIAEVEINPLIVYSEGQGTLALDSRAILKR